jgi:hypothetical protein
MINIPLRLKERQKCESEQKGHGSEQELECKSEQKRTVDTKARGYCPLM